MLLPPRKFQGIQELLSGDPITPMAQKITKVLGAPCQEPKSKTKYWHKMGVHVCSVRDPMDLAHQAPLPMGFSRQEYWSGLPFPPPGDLPNPGVKPRSPALQADSLPIEL